MVQIGKSMKYDSYGRITLPSELAQLLNLEKGDYITWHIEHGSVVLRKVTKIYMNNFDFETDEIKERLIDYEEDHIGESPEYDVDPEELKARAYELYKRDQAAKIALKEKENSC